MKKFLFIFVVCWQSFVLAGSQIALYNDGGYGTWQDGLTALEQFLTWKGVTFQEVNADTINNTDWLSHYEAICFPGGYAYYYKLAINETGIQKIQQFVDQGGGYLGICAGAFFASDSVEWEEDGLLDYPLNLFDGVAIGAIDSIAPWDNYTMTRVNLNPRHPINQFEPSFETILYYGGPYFRKHESAQMDTVGAWDSYFNLPGIVTCNYGQGRVLLMGPHPEVEEDSDRDSTTFADELNDAGSDWPFLWSAVDWLLGQPITYPQPSAIHKAKENKSNTKMTEIRLSPNPFNGTIKVSFSLQTAVDHVQLTIFDVLGRTVQRKRLANPSGNVSVIFELERAPSGIYFLRIEAGDFFANRKLVLVR